MTITTSVAGVDYDGDGADVSFPTTFYFQTNSHVAVATVDSEGAETSKFEGVDYTLTGAGAVNGGTVTMTVAPAVGVTLRIRRIVPLTQPTSFSALGTFSPAIHEAAFDRATMQAQQVQSAATDLMDDVRAEVVALRADIAADPGATALDARTVLATGTTTARTLAAWLSDDGFNVKAFGAVGDGINDDTSAIEAAIEAARSSGGGTVKFPRGSYRCTSTITIPVDYTIALVGQPAGWHRPLARIIFAQTDATDGFYIDGTARSAEATVYMAGLYIDGNNSLGACIHFNSYSWATLEHVMTDRGAYGLKLVAAYINRFQNCKFYRAVNDGVYINDGNENNFIDCHMSGNPGYGVNIVDGSANYFIGDCSLNDTGQFLVTRGQSNTIDGYIEPDVSYLAVKFGKYTSYNKVLAWTSEMYCQDDGFGNSFPSGQSCRPVYPASWATLVQNLLPDSSFTEGVGSWFSTASTITQDTTTGVTTGTSMKVTASSTGVNAVAQCTVVPALSVVDEDVYSISGWVKASKVMTRSGTYCRLGLNLGGSSDLYPVHYTIPYVDTDWRPFAMVARVEQPGVVDAMNLHLVIANPTAGDWIKIADMQCIRNPPKSIDPLGIPYLRNGLTKETFTAQSFGASRNTDSSAAPGSATANTLRGTAAIAAGANTCTITNSKCLAVDTVVVQDESGDATGIRLKAVPADGSFVVTCMNAAGTPTNATANLVFSWAVIK